MLVGDSDVFNIQESDASCPMGCTMDSGGCGLGEIGRGYQELATRGGGGNDTVSRGANVVGIETFSFL